MLRIFSIIFTVIAAICALLSPVLIGGWLLKATEIPAGAGFVNAIETFVAPWNLMLDGIVKLPSMTVQGRSYPTTQAGVAIIFTLGFFLFHFLSELMKTFEQRIRIQKENYRQHQRLAQIARLEKQTKKQMVGQNWRLQTRIQYDFTASQTGSALVQRILAGNNAKILQPVDTRTITNTLLCEFVQLDQALKTCQELVQEIKESYAKLRPIDPQPPISVGLHAVEIEQSDSPSKIAETDKVSTFAGKHQVVFSQTVKALLDSQKLGQHYKYQSIGVYMLTDGRQEEMYRLDVEKPRLDQFTNQPAG